MTFRTLLLAGLLAIGPAHALLAAEGDLERIMWEHAQESKDIENVEAFIDNFPESEHIGEARELAAALSAQDRARTLESSIFDTLGAVKWSEPLQFGDEHLIGKTLAEVIKSTPAFPPIEGLPDEVWKDKTCDSCHQWTREALCTQAKTYIEKDPAKYRGKQHPFGGLLKINMRNWAQNDCQ